MLISQAEQFEYYWKQLWHLQQLPPQDSMTTVVETQSAGAGCKTAPRKVKTRVGSFALLRAPTASQTHSPELAHHQAAGVRSEFAGCIALWELKSRWRTAATTVLEGKGRAKYPKAEFVSRAIVLQSHLTMAIRDLPDVACIQYPQSRTEPFWGSLQYSKKHVGFFPHDKENALRLCS